MRDLTTAEGYAAPTDISPLTWRVLRALRDKGTVVFTFDDGPSMSTYAELLDIAGLNDLSYYGKKHRLVLIDDDFQVIRGALWLAH